MSADEGLHEEHEEHVNHEAWVIPYADLLTLLMAMFIALFAMSTVDLSKFKEVALSFNRALGGSELNTGVFAESKGDSPLDGQGKGPSVADGGMIGPSQHADGASAVQSLLDFRTDLKVARAEEHKALESAQQHILAEAEARGFAGFLSLRIEKRGLIVTVVTDQVLFASGSADLRAEGEPILRVVGDALRSLDNPVLVEGHTDSDPIATAQFPSNWELSTARAGAVIRFLESQSHLPEDRLAASGYADQRPVAPNDTAANKSKNRRVEIVVQAVADEKALAALERRIDVGSLQEAVGHIDKVETGLPEPPH